MSVDPLPHLHHWVLAHATERPTAPAVTSGGTTLTYAGLAHRSLALAARLQADGLVEGQRVLIAASTSIGAIVATLAAGICGAVVVAAPLGGPAGGLAEIMRMVRPTVVFLDDRAAASAEEGLTPEGPRVWRMTRGPVDPSALVVDVDGGPEVTGSGPVRVSRPETEAPALVLFTSGSTGRPLGVVQTHANIAANTRSIVDYLELTAADRGLLILPLHYCYGRSVLQTHLSVGGSVVLEPRAAFPRTVLTTMAAEACTGFAGVPQTFEVMRRLVASGPFDLPALRYVTQAGGAMGVDTIRWARDAFAPARLFVMYGQTEATARLTYLPPERAATKEGSIGIPIPGVELRVVDDAGRDVPDGEIGHLIARGANVTPGYLDEPEATAAILRDGWLWTGDIAERDADGFLFHRGRAKEILKVGGRRVSPAEIEAALLRQPGVTAAVVVGRPDPVQGEVPIAYVVPGEDVDLDADRLRLAMRGILPAWMIPAAIVVRAELPRNEAGKVLRARLRAEASAA